MPSFEDISVTIAIGVGVVIGGSVGAGVKVAVSMGVLTGASVGSRRGRGSVGAGRSGVSAGRLIRAKKSVLYIKPTNSNIPINVHRIIRLQGILALLGGGGSKI